MKKTFFAAVLFAVSFNVMALDLNPAMISGVVGAIGGGFFGGSSSNDMYGRSGDQYSRQEGLRNGDVKDAVVLQVRQVTMEASNSASTAGSTVGGTLGGVIGTTVSNNNIGKYIGGIAGAVAGAAVGQTVGRYAGEKKAGEVLVQLSNGTRTFVVQEDGLNYQPGQKVFVFGSNQGNMRITPNTTGLVAAQ